MGAAPVAIYGAGQQGVVVWDCLTTAGREVVAFIDDSRRGTLVGLPVVGCASEFAEDVEIALAIGDNRSRSEKFVALKAARRRITSVIHPTASVALTATLGEGVTLLQQSVVCAGVSSVGDGTILDVRAVVGHNTQIGRWAHVVAAVVGARCSVEEGAFVAAGAYVLNGVTLGAWSVCGAGALVTKDVRSSGFVVGRPARSAKRA